MKFVGLIAAVAAVRVTNDDWDKYKSSRGEHDCMLNEN